MKNLLKIALVAIVLISFTGMANAQDKKSKEDKEKILAPFPKAEEGMVRHVIYLNEKLDESSHFKVEIIPGKVMSVDCNAHSLMGNIEEKNLDGWGYTYYVFSSNGQATSTMRACNEPNTDKFVYGKTLLLRYNSKLPIIVYIPKGYDVKYKIWKAGKEKESAEM